MAESESPTPAPEAEQQQTSTREPVPEAPDVDSMLSALPGFDQYFGDSGQKSEEPPKEPAPSGDEVPEEETTEVPPEPVEVEAEAKEEEKEESAVQKRIDKLVAQKHEASERAEKAEARVKELEAATKALPVLAPTRAHPLTHVQTIPELEQKLIDARKVKMWALENLDGGPVQQGEGVQDLDGAQVKKLLATAESLISEHIPQRLQYLEARTVHDAEARKHYPNFFKTDTEEYQLLQKWVQLIPEVLNFPDFRLIIADGLAGQRARLARNGAQKNGAIGRTPPLAVPQPSSAPRTPQKSVLSKDLLNRIATDRRALDAFSESLIGTGGGSKK